MFSYRNYPHTTTRIPLSDLMFNRKVKFTIPNIDEKLNIDNINKDFKKNISASKLHAVKYHDKRFYAKNISPHVGDEVMIKQRKFNKLTPIFEPTPCIAIYKKTLIKAKPITAIAWLQETYHIFLEFQKMLSFQIVHLINQKMTLNTLNPATMIITIKIEGAILYITDNAFANMVLHLNYKHFD